MSSPGSPLIPVNLECIVLVAREAARCRIAVDAVEKVWAGRVNSGP